MNRRHLMLPHVWMMTDERQGEAMWAAIERLPRGAGIVVRHYSLAERDRERLFLRIRAIGRQRGLTVAFSGSGVPALHLGAHAVYGASRTRPALPRLNPVHDCRELIAAGRVSAALIFLSPAFATRSHPDGRVLGAVRFGTLARHASAPVIALGGMSERKYRRLKGLGAQGWAAIDAWIRT